MIPLIKKKYTLQPINKSDYIYIQYAFRNCFQKGRDSVFILKLHCCHLCWQLQKMCMTHLNEFILQDPAGYSWYITCSALHKPEKMLSVGWTNMSLSGFPWFLILPVMMMIMSQSE